ncbi:MAG: YjgP/YjgQ family permease [Lentisphaeria bacterium]|nr:LptF/LptG family permease [Lentisphaeria bacterium]NQZ66639.1 YjgP/YjgQ family permease [Lentisphaeria bacterium]
MNKINRYLTINLLLTFSITVAVSTFMVVLVVMVKGIAKLMGKGFDLSNLLTFIFYSMPQLLCFSLPISILISTILVFNRMSADCEITAMKANGISLLQIITPALLLAIVVSAVCWYLQMYLGPIYKYKSQWLLRNQAMQNPLSMLEADEDMELAENFHMLVGSKEGNIIKDVHIYILEESTTSVQQKHKNQKDKDDNTQIKSYKLAQNITAREGKISLDASKQTMNITLYDAIIISRDPKADLSDLTHIKRMTTEESEFIIPFSDHANARRLGKRPKEMTMDQIFASIQVRKSMNQKSPDHYLQLHKRAAWALAPLSFLLFAMPLGLQMSRRETSAGLIVSIFVAGGYFILMAVLGEALGSKINPSIGMWIPDIILQTIGIYLIWKRR